MPLPEIYAHRGGALLPENIGIENTIRAFARAWELGCTWLETDVRASADGVVYAVHDPDLARLAGHAGTFDRLHSRDIDRFRIGGREPIPRLTELLEALPGAKFNIDVKDDSTVAPVIRLVHTHDWRSRIRLASFSTGRLVALRRALPGIRTSTGRAEVVRLYLERSSSGRWGTLGWPGIDCVQIPLRFRGMSVASRGFIHRAHEGGFAVHVWTVNEARDMESLCAAGVDGIVTDRPDLAFEVLSRLPH